MGTISRQTFLFFIFFTFFITSPGFCSELRKDSPYYPETGQVMEEDEDESPRLFRKLRQKIQRKKHTKDSIRIGECFKRLIMTGYNPSNYALFIQNSYYGGYPSLSERSYQSMAAVDPPNPLAKKVDNMITLDQAARNYWWPDSGCIDWSKVAAFDSANQMELLNMVKQYGKLPGIKELGYRGKQDMTIMLRHINDPTIFTPLHSLLIHQAIAGDFSPDDIAGVIDYYWLKVEPVFIDSLHFYSIQLYGTGSYPLKNGKRIFVPILDKEETERLRKEIGLPPLQAEFDKNPDLIWDDELYKSIYTLKSKIPRPTKEEADW